ncbi:hypothetical protein EF294_10080 [Gordonia oryzae]|uniref:Uncharacterized protein n=1 Tax=Gordonia oryzae TaxID=2487349 RepID=A0A3N4GHJ2_9ACTN|nr:hypothetical protein [Gordonia oryzae]RPA62333.1 hypothetical protein EF294_10080 [Gordonia oryzae]
MSIAPRSTSSASQPPLPTPSARSPRRRWGLGASGIALATALALAGGAGLAHAAPTPAPHAPATHAPTTGATATTSPSDQIGGLINQIELGAVPLDSELADAVRKMKAAGVDQMALKAAEAVKSSLGQISPDQITGLLGQLPLGGLSSVSARRDVDTITDPSAVLRAAGIQTFTPSIAPFCTAPTADNPLGLVTAGAGAVAGPWPMKTEPTTQISQILQMIPGVKVPPLAPINLVGNGQTGYAFVPASPVTDGKIQVAWFNTSTLQGGFADLQSLTDNPQAALLTKMIPALGAIRLAPVETGKGTILSAVYGTARNGSQSCFFLPAVGIVDATS